MSLMRNLSENLNAIKHSRMLSLSEFAEELCIARSSLQNILNGNSNPRLDTINQIADRLNTDAVTLLQGRYSAEQYKIVFSILDATETFGKLSDEDKAKASELFHQLVMLLDKNRTS